MVRESVNTQQQNAWKELIEKEAVTRCQWRMKYGQEEEEEEESPRHRVRRPAIPKFNTNKSDEAEKKKKEEEDKKKREEEEKEAAACAAEVKSAADLLRDMKPVTPAVRAQLYEGFSKDGTGRYAYLVKRKDKNPDHRYEFPVTQNLEYGWKIADIVNAPKKPEHGRSKIIKDSFYRTNGIF